jgi:hypothetical protein
MSARGSFTLRPLRPDAGESEGSLDAGAEPGPLSAEIRPDAGGFREKPSYLPSGRQWLHQRLAVGS